MDQIPLDLSSDPKRTALTFVASDTLGRFQDGFEEWLSKNFHIWLAFEQQANRMWARGRRKYSARTILHWIRHETALREDSNELGLKINNNWSPDLGRLYECYYPERVGFFEKRVGQSAKRAA